MGTLVTNPAVDLFAQFATDEVREEAGFQTLIPNCGSVLFTVARTNNKGYLKLFQKLYKKVEPLIKAGGDVADKKSEEIYIDVMAATILLGWEGSIAFKGESLVYSKENAKKLLALKEFRAAVSRISEDVENFKAVQEAEEEKN